MRSPFEDHGLVDEHVGVAALCAAWELLHSADDRRFDGALTELDRAAAHGIPAALEPHARAARGVTLIHLNRADQAIELLRTSWREYPDVAVLPALLGAALHVCGQHADAARTLFAAALEPDPDESLQIWRTLLTQLLPLLVV